MNETCDSGRTVVFLRSPGVAFFKVPILGAGSGGLKRGTPLRGVTAPGPHCPRLSLKWHLLSSLAPPLGSKSGLMLLPGIPLPPGILPESLASRVYISDVSMLFACKTLTLLSFWTNFSTFFFLRTRIPCTGRRILFFFF